MAPPNRRTLLKGGASLAALAALPACQGGRPGAGAVDAPTPAPGPTSPAPDDDGRVFRHGVASGDPLPGAVILWTRISGAPAGSAVRVGWEVATDPDFTNIVRRAGDGVDDSSGAADANVTGPERDYTLKLDVSGLRPGTRYYYRFEALGQRSPVGRTRTAPSGALEQLRLGVATCGDYSRGLWNAYARLAEREDIDAVLHLGDYIYETDRDRVRAHQPPVEIRSLDEYRARYASYRAEPELQAVHAAHPMIWVWDDHETVDGTWMNGADPNDHDPAEDGDFGARKLAARTAAFEWLPIRLPEPEANPERIYRRFQFGDLVDLIMLDTRRIGRDRQGEPNAEGGFFTQSGEFTDPERHILGAEQEAWFINALRSSPATWRLVGNQVVFAQIKIFGAPNATGLSIYANPDQWDGYEPARERILDAIEAGGVDNVVFLTGDVHAALAFEVTRDPNNPAVYLPRTGIGTHAVEFVTPSISSGGDVSSIPNPGDDPDNILEDLIAANGDLLRVVNPHGQYFDSRNGYLIVDINRDRLQAEYWLVPTVTAPSDEQTLDATLSVPSGTARIDVV